MRGNRAQGKISYGKDNPPDRKHTYPVSRKIRSSQAKLAQGRAAGGADPRAQIRARRGISGHRGLLPPVARMGFFRSAYRHMESHRPSPSARRQPPCRGICLPLALPSQLARAVLRPTAPSGAVPCTRTAPAARPNSRFSFRAST